MRALLVFLIATAACSFDFEKQSHVSKLRVLAVRADPPSLVVTPGEPIPQVEITALAIGSEGQPVEVEFALCKATGLPSASLDCPGADGMSLPSTSDTSAVLDLGAMEMPPDLPETIPLAIGFEAQSAGQKLHGFAAYTVRTSADADPPRNPVVSLEVADTVRAGEKVQLTPRADCPHVTFSFYATDGEMEALRATEDAPQTDWTAPSTPGPVQLWIVARDGKGGVGWLARTVQVVP